MLNHSVIGPYEDGSCLVVYSTPGDTSVTIACACRTKEQADEEAARLNREQVIREMNIRRDRELRGLGGVYPGLSNSHC